MGEKVIVENRRARHDYHVLDTVEAGIVLTGTEAKSLRMQSSMTLKDSYADIRGGELFLLGAHIPPYERGNIYNHDPERDRKLLLHRGEILKLGQRVAEKGLTMVPLRVYYKKGIVKVLIGVCRGKHSYDKRTAIKEKESKREMDRAIRQFQKEK
ncbi:MAG: SsrA-binding protein SmpB [Candidatus Hydrogenedentes bacterium]|nr:SsrA-binding protein SmpB [Candidatus Hydrogenedentota bacterium]